MGPVCTPMRVCVCVSIVVDAGGAPPPKGNGGGGMFGCYGNQHTQGRHAFMWCHGVRCPRTPRCHPTRPGSGCVNHVRCTTTATEPRRPLQQHCTCMNPRGVPPKKRKIPAAPGLFGLVAVCIVGGGPPVCCAWHSAVQSRMLTLSAWFPAKTP